MTGVTRYSFLYVNYEEPYLKLSYSGNMGASRKTVSECLERCELPPLETFRTYPSFVEEGSPAMLYEAQVLFEDIPSDVRLDIARIVCNVGLKFDIEEESIDARLRLLPMFKARFEIISKCLE